MLVGLGGADQRDHRIAETLQQAILTPPEPLDALEVAWLYQPALAASDVGGDFYDIFGLGDGHAAIMVGDVAGKGLDAARLTTLLRDGARAYLLEERDPAAVLTRLNALAYRFMPAEKFATAFLGVLECTTGALRYASVGHPPPVVLGSNRSRVLEPEPGLIGAIEGVEFTARQTSLDLLEKLVLFTDGVTEARQGRCMLGESGVFDALQALSDTPVSEIPQALLTEVLAFSNGRLRDDVVIVAVARRPMN